MPRRLGRAWDEGAPVLMVHPEGDRYGADRMLLETVRSVRERGGRAVVCLSAGGPLVGDLEELGAEVRIVPFPVLRQATVAVRPLVMLALRTPFQVARLRRVVRSIGPAVVYVNTVALPHWLAAARTARVPSVCHVREADPAGAGRLKRTILLAPLVCADRLVANSVHTADALRVVPGLRAKAVVIHNGFDAPAGLGPSTGDGRSLVLLGRLNQRKGHLVALDALAQLRDEGEQWRLRIVGTAYPGYEAFEAELHARIDVLDLAARVTLAGFGERWSEMARADIVLIPSLSEPFGNVAVEAMLTCRPVVASAVGGLREIIEDAHTGLLVPPGDATALAGAVRRLLHDPELGRRLGRAGQGRAEERFSGAGHREAVFEAMASAGRR